MKVFLQQSEGIKKAAPSRAAYELQFINGHKNQSFIVNPLPSYATVLCGAGWASKPVFRSG
ncbi:hypothetical protein M2133_002433 [Parabacteroides sp. PF5-6]|nr:hypothetical protein [Parabacteroides sp. PF5-6]